MHNIMTSFIILSVVNYTSSRSFHLFEYLSCIMISLFKKIKETTEYISNLLFYYKIIIIIIIYLFIYLSLFIKFRQDMSTDLFKLFLLKNMFYMQNKLKSINIFIYFNFYNILKRNKCNERFFLIVVYK